MVTNRVWGVTECEDSIGRGLETPDGVIILTHTGGSMLSVPLHPTPLHPADIGVSSIAVHELVGVNKYFVE